MSDEYESDSFDKAKDARDAFHAVRAFTKGDWSTGLDIEQKMKERAQLRELSEAAKRQAALQAKQVAIEEQRLREAQATRQAQELERARVARLPKCPDCQQPLDGVRPRKCSSCRADIYWLRGGSGATQLHTKVMEKRGQLFTDAPLTRDDAEVALRNPEACAPFTNVIGRLRTETDSLKSVLDDPRTLELVENGENVRQLAQRLLSLTDNLQASSTRELAHVVRLAHATYEDVSRIHDAVKKKQDIHIMWMCGWTVIATLLGLVCVIRVFGYKQIGIWQLRALAETGFVLWLLHEAFMRIKGEHKKQTDAARTGEGAALEAFAEAHWNCLQVARVSGPSIYPESATAVSSAVSSCELVISESQAFIDDWQKLKVILEKENAPGDDLIRTNCQALSELLATPLANVQRAVTLQRTQEISLEHAARAVADAYSRLWKDGKGPDAAMLRKASEGYRGGKLVRKAAAPRGVFVNSLGMQLIAIRPGTFLMGSPEHEDGRDDAEEFLHRVEITQAFLIGRHQVTQSQFSTVMGFNPSLFRGADYPVEHVSWSDAHKFCQLLSDLPEEKQAGRVYRLPTEAEWEYACRAGTNTAFHYGTELRLDMARFSTCELPFARPTARAGCFPPNAWGLHDMHGNVWEWTNDWYDAGYYRQSPAADPQGPAVGTHHVLRGGSASVTASECRSACRGEALGDAPQPLGGPQVGDSFARYSLYGDFGLRVVCDSPELAGVDFKVDDASSEPPRKLAEAAISEMTLGDKAGEGSTSGIHEPVGERSANKDGALADTDGTAPAKDDITPSDTASVDSSSLDHSQARTEAIAGVRSTVTKRLRARPDADKALVEVPPASAKAGKDDRGKGAVANANPSTTEMQPRHSDTGDSGTAASGSVHAPSATTGGLGGDKAPLIDLREQRSPSARHGRAVQPPPHSAAAPLSLFVDGLSVIVAANGRVSRRDFELIDTALKHKCPSNDPGAVRQSLKASCERMSRIGFKAFVAEVARQWEPFKGGGDCELMLTLQELLARADGETTTRQKRILQWFRSTLGPSKSS